MLHDWEKNVIERINKAVDGLAEAFTRHDIRHTVSMPASRNEFVHKVIHLRDIGTPVRVSCESKNALGLTVRTQKLAIVVGGLGEKKRFPEPKNGFDFDRVAEHVLARIEEERKLQEFIRTNMELRRQREQLLSAVLVDVGPAWGVGVTARADDEHQGFQIEVSCDEKQLRAVMKALREVLGGPDMR